MATGEYLSISMAPKAKPGEPIDTWYDADVSEDERVYYSGDNSDLESDEDLDYTRKELRYKRALRKWYKSHSNRIGPKASVETIEDDIKKRLQKKYEERRDEENYSSDEEEELAVDEKYCQQLSENSEDDDPREGADMGRDFYWNPSDDSSADEMEIEELQQIDPDDPVVDQRSFQPDPVWNSSIDPQVGLWGTNNPHAPFPGSTLKWHSIVWDDGTTYEGLSRENIPHAYGTLVMGNAYAGNLVEPNVGRGVKYEGMFRAGAVEGMGQMSWPKGKVYRGEWVQGQKHGCGAMFDFSPMIKLAKEEGKTPAEAWEETKDLILSSAQKGTWDHDKFVSDPIDEIESGMLPNYVTTKKIDPKDLCDTAIIKGVLEELDSVVQRARMFQHKPDGDVAIRFLQDGRGTPAPVAQDPLFYQHGTKWMAPGPVGQTYALPDDENLKKHLSKVAENYHKIYRMYNLPFDMNKAHPDMKRAEEFWPEEYFTDGPNSAWWYKNVLYPLEKRVEEDIKTNAGMDQQEYRKKGKEVLNRNWVERGKDMVDAFFSNGKWRAKNKAEKEDFEMIKDFVKDCEETGFMSSWKLTQNLQKAEEERRKDIKKVSNSSKEKEFKKKELLYSIDQLHQKFDTLTPSERREKGQAIVRDISDYGFLKEFTKKGNVEVSASDSGDRDERIVQFPKLKSKDWDKEPSIKAPKRIMNPILDPIDISRLTSSEKKRWQEVLNFLYNELPEDDSVMQSLLTEEQKEFVEFYKSKYGTRSSPAGKSGASSSSSESSGVVTPPTNLASLSIGLTRFSFYLNNQMSHIAKRATRHHLFNRKKK